jgi:hypothetical protein
MSTEPAVTIGAITTLIAAAIALLVSVRRRHHRDAA